ncbi:MAG: tetratricopeptide repeat protein, partial [Planctomycetes bacterium]|nr:tetratricopeptide repeat protein [Planctomycetota bacterium]
LSERATASLASRRMDRIDATMASIGDRSERARAMATFDELKRSRSDLSSRAMARFEQLAAMTNPAPDAILNLGDMHLVAGNDTLAERHYRRYLDVAKGSVAGWDEMRRKAPDEIASKNELERTLATIEGKRKSAVDKTVRVLEHLAEIKYRRRNFQDAAALLAEAIELDPNRHELHVPMAECLVELDQDDEALKHLEIYLRRSQSFDASARKATKMRAQVLDRIRASGSSEGL